MEGVGSVRKRKLFVVVSQTVIKGILTTLVSNALHLPYTNHPVVNYLFGSIPLLVGKGDPSRDQLLVIRDDGRLKGENGK